MSRYTLQQIVAVTVPLEHQLVHKEYQDKEENVLMEILLSFLSQFQELRFGLRKKHHESH